MKSLKFSVSLIIAFISCFLINMPNLVAEPSKLALNEIDDILEIGISDFFNSKYEEALISFNYILSQSNSTFYGAALWGRAFCHLALEDESSMDGDIFMLIDSTLKCPKCKNQALQSYYNDGNLDFQLLSSGLIIDEENVSIAECQIRATNTANLIRDIISEKLPSPKDSIIRPKFRYFINVLEAEARQCCKSGTYWATCLQPLAQKWREWSKNGLPKQPN